MFSRGCWGVGSASRRFDFGYTVDTTVAVHLIVAA